MDPSASGGVRTWRAAADDGGVRLDVFLAGRCPELSRSAAARLIRESRVRVDGSNAKPGRMLRPGETVTYAPAPLRPARPRPQALPLEVVFEDRDLAVVNKPPGLVTHPAPGHPEGTLVNALLHHLRDLSGVGGEQRPGIVHRLDKDTSGLLLVAKHDRAHRALAAAIAGRRVRREYDALVWGILADPGLTLETSLGRDPRHRRRFTVVAAGGRAATTVLIPERRFGNFTLVRARLETGRTHQIRVHCRYAGHPLVGDRTYGRTGEAGLLRRLGLPRPARQLLHAGRLGFTHPFTGQVLAWQACRPRDFEDFLTALGTLPAPGSEPR